MDNQANNLGNNHPIFIWYNTLDLKKCIQKSPTNLFKFPCDSLKQKAPSQYCRPKQKSLSNGCLYMISHYIRATGAVRASLALLKVHHKCVIVPTGHTQRHTTRHGPEWAWGNHLSIYQFTLSPGHEQWEEQAYKELSSRTEIVPALLKIQPKKHPAPPLNTALEIP